LPLAVIVSVIFLRVAFSTATSIPLLPPIAPVVFKIINNNKRETPDIIKIRLVFLFFS